ncbi:F-box only protein 40-like [Aplochiton taeniatus]
MVEYVFITKYRGHKMSGRSRPSRARLHLHCESCFSRRCRAPVEVSVSCVLTPCRLLCGAVFHLCKEEEHALLCPNEKVPCLNAQFGCPITMLRSRQASHLEVCPSSVVCCSMEWLRWPVDETDQNQNTALHENLLKENLLKEKVLKEKVLKQNVLKENLLKEKVLKEKVLKENVPKEKVLKEKVLKEKVLKEWSEGQGAMPPLDLVMALMDQKHLYSRLKMKNIYPQLVEEEEEKEEGEAKRKQEENGEVAGATDSHMTCHMTNGVVGPHTSNGAAALLPSPAQNGTADTKAPIDTEKYNKYEKMFSMDRKACDVAEAKLNNPQPAGDRPLEPRDAPGSSGGEGVTANGFPPPDTTRSGHAPWDPGVLARLGKELTPQEMTMYLVHNGRALLTFGQIEACTPRERDFVYGSLEPIPVQTLYSFKVPVSYRSKDRSHQYDSSVKVKTEEHSVDTSDLGAPDDSWHGDEAATTLLGYAEIEVKGHKISESKGTDGLFVDEGTQTHSFSTMPFKRDTVLADVTGHRPLKLRLQLHTESVDSRHHKASSAFTFLCGHSFLRREFPQHFRNVHSDIQTCVSGWFEQRCPLAYLGCTYSQRRLQPSTHTATVTYNEDLAIFNLRPILPVCLEDQPPQSSSAPGEPHTNQGRGGRRAPGRGGEPGGREVSLSTLPYEVLCHLASFLDSLSLSQLALVSRLMREVCSSLLQTRGMVSLHWDRSTSSHGGARWRAKPVWRFSHLFSHVESWRFLDAPSMSTHLSRCPYFQTSPPSEPWALPSMSDRQADSQEERLSLVKQFIGNH